MSRITEAADQLAQATQEFESRETSVEATIEEMDEEQTGSTQGPIDIDSQEKILFQGQEYTPEELNKAMLRQADYTKKTQELAKERKYMDNLLIDLDNVRGGFATVEEFKAVYPEKFHAFVEQALNKSKVEQDTTQIDDPNTIEYLQQTVQGLQKKLETYDNKFRDEKVEAEAAKLDAVFDRMGSKYELADEDAVMNSAQRLLEENRDNPNFRFTEGTWERLYKRDHERRIGLYEERQKRLMDKQKTLNKKGNDGGPGGQAPGRERKKFSFDEATEMAIQDLRGR